MFQQKFGQLGQASVCGKNMGLSCVVPPTFCPAAWPRNQPLGLHLVAAAEAAAAAAAAAAVVVPDALLLPLDCAAPSGGSTELPGVALPPEPAAPGQALPQAHE